MGLLGGESCRAAWRNKRWRGRGRKNASTHKKIIATHCPLYITSTHVPSHSTQPVQAIMISQPIKISNLILSFLNSAKPISQEVQAYYTYPDVPTPPSEGGSAPCSAPVEPATPATPEEPMTPTLPAAAPPAGAAPARMVRLAGVVLAAIMALVLA